MTDQRAEGLRREIAEHGGGRGVRYDADLKARAIRYLREQRAAGVSLTQLARELGLHIETIGHWSASTPPTMRVVEIAPEPKSSNALAIVTSGGERLEGLSREDAIAILRALR
jgi:hypothetical protein